MSRRESTTDEFQDVFDWKRSSNSWHIIESQTTYTGNLGAGTLNGIIMKICELRESDNAEYGK